VKERLNNLLNTKIPMMIAIPLLLLLIVSLWGYASSNMILRQKKEPLDAHPKTFGLDYETWNVQTEDGIAVEGWFVPAKKRTNRTLHILHGWGANKSNMLESTVFLADRYNLAYFDFRNHGRSGGNETSLGLLEMRDFKASVRYLKTEKKSSAEKLGVLGFSMGAVVAIAGSAKMPEIEAVAAESPFASYEKTATRYAKKFFGAPHWVMPLTFFCTRLRLGFDPEEGSAIRYVARIAPRPILIIQGGADSRMPDSEGESLFKEAREPKEYWFVPGADHGTVYETAPDTFRLKVGGFFDRYLP
jgi:pimeloyl-ACP methyl ester carboxylesterase